MTRLEMVEKLREKTGVSYDIARAALENNNWDMLDAVIALERDADYRETVYEKASQSTSSSGSKAESDGGIRDFASGFGDKLGVVIKFLLNLIGKGEKLRFEILYKDNVIGSLSATVLALLLIFCWYIPVALGILGFLLGYRFRFSAKTAADQVMSSISIKVKEDAEKELELASARRKEE